ncbi:hypothetical protein evm_003093 [Chilo suppressalis]|nr:hypothetical protein evm_003093 [Chilo suppressalis]
MSDPKRATLITVGAPKSAKNNVNKTVRLTINLVESNESKYPELNYKELVIAEERKKKVENGKTTGLDPFSDNDDDVKQVARKFEQKYGGKSTYGRTGRTKQDEFADIGAGYDENDSFIDNTDGYDEMIPPECDTFYGGFYINSGSLEFKSVPENQTHSDADPRRNNKRRISSSSSEEESSESSSESSQDEKDPKAVANGVIDSHKTEHRKKKNKKVDKKKAKKIRRTDSSAATSGKQTSDDNAHGDGESVDSRTSHSDSLTSKPAPSSENAVTSDSSRDVEPKSRVKLPPPVAQLIEELEAVVKRCLTDNPNATAKDLELKTEHHIARLSQALSSYGEETGVKRTAWARAARCLRLSRAKLVQRATLVTLATPVTSATSVTPVTLVATNPQHPEPTTTAPQLTTAVNNKRKAEADHEDIDYSRLTPEEREEKIVDTLQKLKALIEERKPGMIGSYNAECERVREERKKIKIASATDGAPHIEKRMPKRRFPWCPRSRALLHTLRALAGHGDAAAALLSKRALPLFPAGFVRMPTLLRQADLSKEIKAASETKRQRLGSASQPPASFTEPIHFPSSLTVTATTTNRPTDKQEDDKYKSQVFGTIINSFSLSKDLIVEKPDDRKKEEKSREDLYIPPNNIGSITITPVPNSKEKKLTNSVITSTEKHPEGLIRVKSPAALNDMVKKDKEKNKKPEKNHVKEKRVDLPIHVDTTLQTNKKEPSPPSFDKPKESLIRVKSPAALNDMCKKDKDKNKKPEKTNHVKDKKVEVPLHVDTSFPSSKKEPSPKNKEEISQKQIESMRIAENNIPRPALVPVHHSPTFAKPDKRPPEVKKKKDVVIVSDVDPLGDIVQAEPYAVDDSSSDVEVVEDKNMDKSGQKCDKSDSVPSQLKDKVSVTDGQKKVNSVKHCSKAASVVAAVKDGQSEKRSDSLDEPTKEDIDNIMRNIREMEHSQETTKLNSSSYGGVITSVKHEKSSSQPPFNARSSIFGETRSDKDKL